MPEIDFRLVKERWGDSHGRESSLALAEFHWRHLLPFPLCGGVLVHLGTGWISSADDEECLLKGYDGRKGKWHWQVLPWKGGVKEALLNSLLLPVCQPLVRVQAPQVCLSEIILLEQCSHAEILFIQSDGEEWLHQNTKSQKYQNWQRN